MKQLDPKLQRQTYERVNKWNADRKSAVDCPACSTSGLRIIDCSTRPHAEWYVLSCESCGLDAALQIPRGSPCTSID